MSYCSIVPIYKNDRHMPEVEFTNSWGGAARIWSSLFDKYLKNPEIPYDSWMGRSEDLWALAKRKDLDMCERVVHVSTFDRAYIRRDNFKRFAEDLRAFVAKNPAYGKVCHLLAWAGYIEKCKTYAIGFMATSCGENLWENSKLKDGFEVYKWIENKDEEKKE